MKQNIQLLFGILVFSCQFSMFAQNFTMTNGGSTSSCAGSFLDPGGLGNYSGGNGTFVYTICNPTAGQPIYLNFGAFNLNTSTLCDDDVLTIFNGSTTGAPQIGGNFNGNSSPGLITGSSGCLTIRFQKFSNSGFFCFGSNSGAPGWVAAISCTQPVTGNTCPNAVPFCTANTYNFPNATNTTAPAGPNYGCLLTQPNPIWYYMEVDVSGSFQIGINQNTAANNTGSGLDVDFSLYGPFSSLAAGCGSVMSGASAPIQCSYSTAATETIGLGLQGGTSTGQSTPPAGIAGQIYIVLLTNFNGSAGFIDFNQTGGSGVADCSIVNPCTITATNSGPVCPGTIANLTASAVPGATYTWSGPSGFSAAGQNTTVTASAPAGGGTSTYTVTATTGSQTCTATTVLTVYAATNPLCGGGTCLITNFTASSNLANCSDQWQTTGTVEFITAPATGTLIVEDCQGNTTTVASAPFTSPYNWTLNGTDANGLPCFFRAYFSALPTCQSQLNTNYPAETPGDEAGTVTLTQNGLGTNAVRLCVTDNAVITSNDNDVITPLVGTDTPNVGYMVFSCPPTPGGPGINPFTDIPCYQTYFTQEDLTILNNNGAASTFLSGLPGPFTNNTIYIVPMTFLTQIPAASFRQDCYDLAIDQMQTIQFLNPIVPVITQNCTLGTASVSFTGGNPQFYGGNFTASALTPATATFANTTCAHGGTITINGLTNGQVWAFTVTDANGCPRSVTGTFVGLQNAAFTYPLNAYCTTATNPSPTVTGIAGGTYSASPAGLSINATSGLINLTASTPNTYTITYTTPGPTCQGTQTFVLTVKPQPAVNAGPDQTVCQNSSVTLTATGTPLSVYVWNNSVTDGVSFTPAIGSINYTVTATLNGCTNTDVVNVLVNAAPAVNAGVDQTICAGATANLLASGATSYVWNNGAGSLAAAAVTPTTTTTYTVTGTSTTCVSTDQVIVTVTPLPIINAGLDVSICTGQTVTLTGTGAGITASNYSWTGGITQGVAFSPTTTATYTVTGTQSGCSNTDQVVVTVNSLPAVNAGLDKTTCIGGSVTLTATGASTYVWSPLVTNGVAFAPTTSGTYTVTGTDINGCVSTDAALVTINALPIVNAGVDQNICIGATVTLSGSGIAPTVAGTYVWTSPISNGTAFSPTTTQTYTLTGTDANGCVATDNVIVTVNSLPIINAGADLVICTGNLFVPAGSGAVSYSWNNGLINGVQFAPTATQTYTVTGTDANGCVNTDQITVTVENLPIVGFSVNLAQGCAPLSVIFTNTTVGAANITWNISDGSILTGNSNQTHVFNANGCFDVSATATSANGCVNTLTQNNIVCVQLYPIAAFNANPSVMTQLNTSSQMENNSTGATSYSWDFGDGTVSAAENPLHTFPDLTAGSYEVMLIASTTFGCNDTAVQIITVNEELIFYVPNTFTPDQDDYNESFRPIFTSGFDPQEYKLLIFDRWGEVIFESNDSGIGWKGTYGPSSTEIVQQGVYEWKIEFKTNSSKRVMKIGHVNLLK